jgi:hypothetical protein
VAEHVPASKQPVAIVAHDFNGDGHLDLAVANDWSNDVSILMSRGADGFSPATNYPVGTHPRFISAGDFNDDGKTDLVTVNYDSDNISVLFGLGAGTFSEASNFAATDNPYGLAVGDFNGDGRSDLAVGTDGGSNSQAIITVAIMLSDGAGRFASASSFEVGGRINSIKAAKINGDDVLDLAIGMENRSAVFLGNGSGGFSATAALPDGLSVRAAHDFNADGKIDLVGSRGYSYGYSSGIVILLGDGAGSFSAPATFAGDAHARLTVNDFNGDGKNDVATVDRSAGLSILLGDGTGKLGAPTEYGVGGRPLDVVSGDFNADGRIDLAVASSQESVTLLYGTVGGDFAAALKFTVGSRPQQIAVADFNSDGQTDLAVVNTDSLATTQGASSISILLGDGTGRMLAAPPIQFQPFVTQLSSLVTADFNNDGQADLAVSDGGVYTRAVYTMLGKGDGSFAAPLSMGLSSGVHTRAGSSQPTLIGTAKRISSSRSRVRPTSLRYWGTGTGNFNVVGFGHSLGTGNLFEDFAVADINRDGQPDLIFPRFHDNKLLVFLGIGTGHFNSRIETRLARGPLALVVNDFNRDGAADVAVTTTLGSPDYFVSVLYGNGVGGFGGATHYPVGDYSQAITSGDFNGDNLIDLAVANSQSSNVSILTGDGSGRFSPSVHFGIAGPSSVAAADFNRDGKPDLAVSQQGQTVSRFS